MSNSKTSRRSVSLTKLDDQAGDTVAGQIRPPMIWHGGTMFGLTLPLAAVAAAVGGPLALSSSTGSTAYEVGMALLVVLRVVVYLWIGLGVFCVVRRPFRNRVERLYVEQAKAEAGASRSQAEPPQSRWSFGFGVFIDE